MVALAAMGQEPAQTSLQNLPKPVYGSVSGRITCENNLPARLAVVTLLPIGDASEPPTSSRAVSRPVLTPVDTQLDGSFTIPHVAPGYYYVVVQYPGYVSPIAQLNREDLIRPSLEMQKFIASVLPAVAVDPNRVSNVDVRLRRGASINGYIRYDDGSPAPGLQIRVLRKDGKGKWIGVPIRDGGGSDDLGRYRIVGLPAGEYMLEASLQVFERYTDYLFDGGGSSSSGTKFGIKIYSGSETRRRDAKLIKLNDGEDDSSEDMVIPLSKLHSVTGSIVQARTGHVVSAGTVVLLYPDDNSEAFSTKVDKDDSMFHFDFVPEGSYILKVANARDVSREEISNGKNSMPPTHTKETTLKSYGPQQQPLLIEGDLSGLLLPVPEAAAPAKGAQ